MNCRKLAARPLLRSGFTLVELLVVISIIGMLAALLLPAVNAAREAGRKSVCVNNQRQVGLAIFQYEAAKNEYPGYIVPQAVIQDPADATLKTASRPVSWVWTILGRLERNDIVENYGNNAPPGYPATLADAAANPNLSGPYSVANQRINVLLCPSDAQAQDADPEKMADLASLSYVVNTGQKDADASTVVVQTAPDPTYVEAVAVTDGFARDWAANGVFHYRFPYFWNTMTETYQPSGEKVTKVTSSAIADGVATTLLLSENSASGNWNDVFEWEVGFYWQATVDAGGAASPQAGGVGSSMQNAPLDTIALLKINERLGPPPGAWGDGTPNPEYGRPSSYHPGGVVVTYADAHTSFLNADIDYLVYCLIMTPRGKASLPAGSLGISSGSQLFYLDMTTGGNAPLQIFGRSTLSEDSL